MDLIEESRRCARVLEPERAGKCFDVIFAPVASKEIAFCDTDLPIAYLSDATFRVLSDCYPEMAGMPKEWRDKREECEQRAIARADLLIYPSRWAADSAVADYGADPDKTRVIPLGANLHEVPLLRSLCGCGRMMAFAGCCSWARTGAARAAMLPWRRCGRFRKWACGRN